jgi:peptidoglycan hydrolase-like protein with peptidoglycan-binding domain
MNPIQLGAIGLIAWGLYKLLVRSPVSTQATPVIPKPTVTPKPVATAKPAASGTAALQARLNALGASPQLVVDGIPGPKTTAAIKAFQSSHGITPDGIAGPITLAALGMGGATIAAPVAAPVAVPTTYEQVPLVSSTFTPHAAESSADYSNITNVNTWADEPTQSFRNR